MPTNQLVETFADAATAIGAQVETFSEVDAALAYVRERANGPVLLPAFPSGERQDLATRLRATGLEVATGDLRPVAATAAAGVTGANFALAATGSVVLESTSEAVRLATTLPERHFVLLDPAKVIADDTAAIPLIREFHHRQPRNYLAWITGPSRTADIERILTIGVHGPGELHILLVPDISEDPLEM